MNTNERINEIREHFCDGNNKIFSKMLAYTEQYASNLTKNGKSVGKNVIENLSKTFPDLNINWLLTGEGTMLKSYNSENKSQNDIVYIPLLPISAQGGSLNDFVVSVKDSDCEKIISPIKGADWAITVSGDSMSPEYPSGSQILIKQINEGAFIDWGKAYVLDTCNGTVIKILVPSEKEGFVKCISINKDERFAPFEVALNDVYGIYRVLLCMSVK